MFALPMVHRHYINLPSVEGESKGGQVLVGGGQR